MFLLLLLFWLTPTALSWLVVHKVRQPSKTPLPDGLTLLLMLVGLCWLSAIAMFIGNMGRPGG